MVNLREKMSQITHFCGVNFLAWKSGSVKFLTNIMSECRVKKKCDIWGRFCDWKQFLGGSSRRLVKKKQIISNRGRTYREKIEHFKIGFSSRGVKVFFAESSGCDCKFVAIVTGCILRRKIWPNSVLSVSLPTAFAQSRLLPKGP